MKKLKSFISTVIILMSACFFSNTFANVKGGSFTQPSIQEVCSQLINYYSRTLIPTNIIFVDCSHDQSINLYGKVTSEEIRRDVIIYAKQTAAVIQVIVNADSLSIVNGGR